MSKTRIVLGAMSGTSADGVDVAVCEITDSGLAMKARLLSLTNCDYRAPLRRAINQIREGGLASLGDLAAITEQVTLNYAAASLAALIKAELKATRVACIAAHGQTLFHEPPLTIQCFDPALLSVLTECRVVSDFRRADCALDGQGAPLVPFADYLLFRGRKVNRVLLNIGGIANITYLPAGGTLQDVIAFDTGPGNCISDELMRRKFGKPHDQGGHTAARGRPDEHIVDAMLRQAYFRRKPPKSTDGPEMIRLFANAAKHRRVSAEDLVATACLCCARAIATSLRHLLSGTVDEIVTAGGGTRNRTLMRMLREETGLPVRLTDDFGIPSQGREAVAFALLGAATLDGFPSNVPSVTGASRPAILGSITNSLGMMRGRR